MVAPKLGMNDDGKHSPQKEPTGKDTIRELIEQTKPEDYDGHTAFSSMTPSQRSAWLDQAVLFIQSQKTVHERWLVAEDPPKQVHQQSSGAKSAP